MSIKQADSYFINLTITLQNIEDHIHYLLQPEMDKVEYQRVHRKLIKMLTRATTNLRLFKQTLVQIANLPEDLVEKIETFSAELIAFSQRFFMRSTLPNNVDKYFSDLSFLPLKKSFESFSIKVKHRENTNI